MKLKNGLIIALIGFSVACSSDENNTKNNGGSNTNNTTGTNNTNNTTGTNNTNNTTGTNNTNNTTGTNNTNNTNNTTGTNNTTNTNNANCTYDSFPIGNFFFQGQLDGSGGQVLLFEEGATPDSSTILSLEFYEKNMDQMDSILMGPGTFEIAASADDQNYETCTTCVRIAQECDQDGNCGKEFLATKGTIVFTAIDGDTGTVTGMVTGLEAEEVTIDDATFKSTPVPNGEGYCLDSLEFAPECTSDADCTDADKGVCDVDNAVCVGCVSFQTCTDAAKPACIDDTNLGGVCGVVTECTNDDAAEEDDGPAAATVVDISQLPKVIEAKTCSGATNQETDWFKFTVAADNTPIRISLTAANADADIAFILGDAQFTGIARGPVVGKTLAAGDYVILVAAQDTSMIGGGTEATPYTLTIDSGECATDADCTNGELCLVDTFTCVQCLTDANCSDAGAPSCISNACGSNDVCTMDDALEPNSDGPAGASMITIGQVANNKICGDFATIGVAESDWYSFEISAPANIRTTVTWTEADMANPVRDIDVSILDENLMPVAPAQGTPSGTSTDVPEILELTALPAGKYFVRVVQFESAMGAVAEDYSILLENF